MSLNFTLDNFKYMTSEKAELENEFENASDRYKKILEKQLESINIWLKNYNKNLKDYSSFMSYLYKNDISDIIINSVNVYKEKKVLIYSPTQVGKTNAMIQVIKDSIYHGISIIVSCDNKKDQLEQFVKRLTQTKFENTLISIVGNNNNFTNFVEEYIHVDNDYETFIICCLDNASQINKVYEKLTTLNEYLIENDNYDSFDELMILHDEGDVLTKSRDINNIVYNQPASHKEWIKFSNRLIKKGISMKRVFISATPENIICLHKPGRVWSLNIPENYIGSDKIEYHSVNNFEDKNIIKILKKECKDRRVNECGGIILYCVERNKNDLEDKNTQNSVFNELRSIENYKKHNLDVISVYNSDGITVSLRLRKFRKEFIEILVNEKIKHNIIGSGNDTIIVIHKNKLSIADFYKYLQDCECNVVLTIGKDLISRGISFVSSKIVNPLTATTMIYKPGKTLHQVGLCQAIGRLTGTAQPKLQRRLYSTDEISSEYKKFINNQKIIMNAIKANGNVVSDQVLKSLILDKSKRTIDRRVLKINSDFKFEDFDNSSGSETEAEIDGVSRDRMKRLINLWWRADTIIGKILRFVYESEVGVSENELKDFIRENGSTNVKAHYDEIIKHDNRKYNVVFERTNNNITKINKEAKKYILTL